MSAAANNHSAHLSHFVRAERVGALGLITLDRPEALNALSDDMIVSIAGALESWADDDAVQHVAIQSTSDRAFCAGGDIRRVAEASRQARLDNSPAPTGFFRNEYKLNYDIKHYPKPFIALINGIVMGGGVGISVHGSHRIVCEDLRFAMPEVGIGFFPDVGGSYVLPRLENMAGSYLALSGVAIGWRDCLDLGLATHSAERASFADIIERLAKGDDADAVLSSVKPVEDGAKPLLPDGDALADTFRRTDLAEIMSSLDRHASGGAEWAVRAHKSMMRASPTSMKLALAQMKLGRSLNFAETMITEFRIVSRILLGHDFYEGVRALIIDKDRSPVWQPSDLDSVSDADIDAYFKPLAEELNLT